MECDKEDFRNFCRIYKYARIAKVFGQFSLKVLNDTKKYPLLRILCHFGRINATMCLLVDVIPIRCAPLSRLSAHGLFEYSWQEDENNGGRLYNISEC